MPSRRFTFQPLTPSAPLLRGVADWANKQFRNVALAMPNPVYQDLGLVNADLALEPEAYSHTRLTLGASLAITLPVSTVPNGERLLVEVAQDATGSRLVTSWDGAVFPGGVSPTLTTTPGQSDLFEFVRVPIANINLLKDPDDLSTASWTLGGAGTATGAVATYANRSFTRVTGIDATTGLYQPITLPCDGTVRLTMYVHTNGVAGAFAAPDLYDGISRGYLVITIDSGGTVTVTTGAGRLVEIVACGSGVYRVVVDAPGGVKTNSNAFYALTSGSPQIASVLLSGTDARMAAPPFTWRCVNQQLNY